MANRLAGESSPYLLLHKDNPVDWYPWGEEAFARARDEDKPIFLSIGYSTCYWCHVMERESFSDPEIARELNEGFVCVKVDREERPEVDEIYMGATQLITRSGGWPNSVFLTPDLKPFFAGTYFPPQDMRGRPGFPRVLQSLRQAWLFRRAELLQQAEMVAQAMQQHLSAPRGEGGPLPGPEVAANAQAQLAARFDPNWGGFGTAPKFPSPANLFFLLDRADASEEAREMLVATLDAMARGGLMDQLAGGFHRYSTDAQWLVPHFEKMLYDNAALARLYAESARLAEGLGFERVARLTCDFVLRELTGPEGGFLSAIDAETDGHEGAYYTWTAEELDAVLGNPEGRLFRLAHGLEGEPTFEADRYVVYVPAPYSAQAKSAGMSEAELLRRLEPSRRALLAARERRERPLVDDKVLADWNGLMIGALARVGALLREPRYLAAAERAARFVLERLVDSSGTLLHVWRGGRAHVPAYLDDYAFLIEGLLELRAATGEENWLAEAARLAEQQESRLADPQGGYFSAGDDPHLVVRAKTGFDGAVASGNGFAARNAVELAKETGEGVHRQRAEATIEAFAAGLEEAPLAHVTLVRALEALRSLPPSLAVAAGALAAPAAQAAPAPSPSEALEEAAYAAVEIDGRLGTSEDDDWKPFRIELEVKKGWHVNANPAGSGLVPLKVAGVIGGVRNVSYPAGAPWDAGAGPVPVYEGRVVIEGQIERRGGGAVSAEVSYQACDEERCLPPVARIVRLR